MDRIPRRFVDRVLSTFVYTQRYRCRAFACRWEGNLRDDKAKRPSPAR